MPVIIATSGKPEDITNPGFDGKVFRFPITMIDRDDIGTPRQSSKTRLLRIRVEISDSRITTWGLRVSDLVKVAFEIARENLTAAVSRDASKASDLEVLVNTHTHSGPCPFDPTLIQQPEGAVFEIEVKRPIGFI
jgi:hypothetical protein